MEPIVLFGVIILVFGLWQEFEPMILRIGNLILNNKTFIKLASVLSEQKPPYTVNTLIERKTG